MLRHATGFYLANAGQDTRAIQLYLGHKNIQHTVRYTELVAGRFKDFWKDKAVPDFDRRDYVLDGLHVARRVARLGFIPRWWIRPNSSAMGSHITHLQTLYGRFHFELIRRRPPPPKRCIWEP